MVPLCQVIVLYFAKSAEITGVHSETISVPQEIKALQLWKEIETRHPGCPYSGLIINETMKHSGISCSALPGGRQLVLYTFSLSLKRKLTVVQV
uniref:Molybdenum cofactor synthesis 2 n=1 Tax=Theropithecus gelada TaxID=9565 RepID=A0A8D2F2T2_THEGE